MADCVDGAPPKLSGKVTPYPQECRISPLSIASRFILKFSKASTASAAVVSLILMVTPNVYLSISQEQLDRIEPHKLTPGQGLSANIADRDA